MKNDKCEVSKEVKNLKNYEKIRKERRKLKK